MTRKDVFYLIGLVASIATTVGAEFKMFPEQWHGVLILAGLMGTAVTGYLARSPHDL